MIPAYALKVVATLLAGIVALVSPVVLYGPGLCSGIAFELCGGFHADVVTGLGWVATLFGIALAIFNAWIWRTAVGRLMGWPLPDIRGSWSGTLLPVDLPAGIPLPTQPIPIVLVVRQSAFQIHLSLYTAQSSSQSVATEFAINGAGARLVYSYHNTPHLSLQATSPEHYGTAVLDTVSTRPSELVGTYFTSRLSRGEMRLSEHSRLLVHSFNDASAVQFAPRRRLR